MAKQITLAEAARQTGLAPKTLRDAVARGSLKATRAGRDWLTTDRWLQAYLDARPERFRHTGVTPHS